MSSCTDPIQTGADRSVVLFQPRCLVVSSYAGIDEEAQVQRMRVYKGEQQRPTIEKRANISLKSGWRVRGDSEDNPRGVVPRPGPRRIYFPQNVLPATESQVRCALATHGRRPSSVI